MKSQSVKFEKIIWFGGGFLLGFSLIALGHAAIQKPQRAPAPRSSSPVSEMKATKITAPEMDQDLTQLNTLEAKYAESWDQQQRIKAATSRSARNSGTPRKKSRQ